METNEKMKKNGMLKIVLVIILIITVVILAGFAYARYVTSLNGNATMDIAKWSFNYKILNSTQTAEVDNFAVTRNDNNADVDSSTIAPGTSGEFIIEIDATGTETLIAYDTTITFTNKPTNLIFYSNSEKTEAIIVENERYLNLNGFFSLEDNKKRDIPIYWEWKLESGNTPEEIENNDEIDTTFMGKTMSMQIATTGRQVMENPTGKYAVTFDANGGILPEYGNVSQATKQVTYGEAYGDLPVPTREGYTFKGWNGKNMFDEQSILMAIPGATYENEYYKFRVEQAHIKYNAGVTQLANFDENTQYTIRIVGYGVPDSYSTTGFRFFIKYKDGTNTKENYQYVFINSSEETITIKSDNTKTIDYIGMYYGFGGTMYIKSVQLERASTATAYEPYCITTSTPVTQNQNHTLTAIWIEN